MSEGLYSYFDEVGIIQQTTCPATLEENGVVEWKNYHLLEITRALLFTIHVLKKIWSKSL